MSAEFDSRLTLRTARDYNRSLPGRRLTDGNIGQLANTKTAETIADGLYDTKIILGAAGLAAHINLALGSADCRFGIDLGATIARDDWLETQKPYVRGVVMKLGYICSRLEDSSVLVEQQVVAPWIYQRIAVEALCLAALIGLGQRKKYAHNAALLRRPIESIVTEMTQFPTVDSCSWLEILSRTSNDGVRTELIRRHVTSGRSVFTCVQDMRREQDGTLIAYRAEIAKTRIPTQRRRNNKNWYNNAND